MTCFLRIMKKILRSDLSILEKKKYIFLKNVSNFTKYIEDFDVRHGTIKLIN